MAGTRQTSQNRKPPPVPDPVPSPRITIEDTNNKREIPTTNLVSPDTKKKNTLPHQKYQQALELLQEKYTMTTSLLKAVEGMVNL